LEIFNITPIKVGELTTAKGTLTYMVDVDKTVVIPLIMYLIKGRDKLILVDTGGGDEEWVNKYHFVYKRPADEEPAAALKKLGIDIEDIDIVVNTHLHWDHCFNNELFSKAKIYVQKKELQSAISPLPPQGLSYESHLVNMTPPWFKAYERMVGVEGDTNLLPGIDLVTLPGHTPGFQGVLVNTTGGRYLIAGDTLNFYENWEGKGRFKHIAPGIHYDVADCYQTFNKIEKICDHILPGHDVRVFEHKAYPD
jgi:glyoxylase-like metal-dependent hydrolase (beta-lactamase superfamily II)